MLRFALTTNSQFGVVLIRQGLEALGPHPEPYQIGCVARIIELEPLSEGRFNLTAVGGDRFRIVDIDRNRAFQTATVDWLPIDTSRHLDLLRAARLIRPLMAQYLHMISSPAQGDAGDSHEETLSLDEIQLPEDPTMLIYMTCAFLQIPVIEKQALLEMRSVQRLFARVATLLRRELALNSHYHKVNLEVIRRSSWLN